MYLLILSLQSDCTFFVIAHLNSAQNLLLSHCTFPSCKYCGYKRNSKILHRQRTLGNPQSISQNTLKTSLYPSKENWTLEQIWLQTRVVMENHQGQGPLAYLKEILMGTTRMKSLQSLTPRMWSSHFLCSNEARRRKLPWLIGIQQEHPVNGVIRFHQVYLNGASRHAIILIRNVLIGHMWAFHYLSTSFSSTVLLFPLDIHDILGV